MPALLSEELAPLYELASRKQEIPLQLDMRDTLPKVIGSLPRTFRRKWLSKVHTEERPRSGAAEGARQCTYAGQAGEGARQGGGGGGGAITAEMVKTR